MSHRFRLPIIPIKTRLRKKEITRSKEILVQPTFIKSKKSDVG